MNRYNDKSCEFYYKVKTILKCFMLSVIVIFLIYGFCELMNRVKYLNNKISEKARKIESYIEDNNFLIAEDVLLQILGNSLLNQFIVDSSVRV
ncbi:hypothetical protein SZ25_00155, partial [Candidatus Arcanobacter lacustris]